MPSEARERIRHNVKLAVREVHSGSDEEADLIVNAAIIALLQSLAEVAPSEDARVNLLGLCRWLRA